MGHFVSTYYSLAHSKLQSILEEIDHANEDMNSDFH